MNELAFKFGQNSITYEYGRRFVTINGEKHRAGKYYYLNVLESISDYPSLNNQMLSWIMNIYNATNAVYNPDIIRYVSDIQRCMTAPELAGIDAFLTVIYLAMFDLETSKSFPNSLGKDMVLRSCQAVLLKQKTAKEAAVMFEKKKLLQMIPVLITIQNITMNGMIMELLEKSMVTITDIVMML